MQCGLAPLDDTSLLELGNKLLDALDLATALALGGVLNRDGLEAGGLGSQPVSLRGAEELPLEQGLQMEARSKLTMSTPRSAGLMASDFFFFAFMMLGCSQSRLYRFSSSQLTREG
jgi:hypothetical protein